MSDTASAQEWGRRCGAVDWAATRVLLEIYFRESVRLPRMWGGKQTEPQANYCWHLVTFAMNELGMDEESAWDCPVARLVRYRLCRNEREGMKNLMTDSEIEGVEILRRDAAQAG